jgi:predicted PurR-regulated permease PerM
LRPDKLFERTDEGDRVRITIPRWVQMFLIPLAILLAFLFSRTISHAIMVFLVSTMVALLFNAVVIAMVRIKIPRWVAVPIVYVVAIAIVVIVLVFFGPALIRSIQTIFSKIPDWLNSINKVGADIQNYLARHGINVKLQLNTTNIVDYLKTHGLTYLQTIFSVGVSVVGVIVNVILTVIISFYMLIDGRRVFRSLVRIAPGDDFVADLYVRGLQTAFSRYVRGQALLGAAVGVAVGLVVWIFSWSFVGIWPEGGAYAILFGVWAGLTEVIPYIGPWLGGFPPVVAAFFHSPWAALWLIVAIFLIQQLESHVLAPNIVGTSVGVHPLIVIFVLLCGAQIGGIMGMLVSLPLLAMLRHTLQFYNFRFSKASWAGDDGITLIPARTGPAPPKAVPPRSEK